ncbi:DNA polymerase III subunit delta' [Sciscionella sediminilitoris]|uniref:DNA polymerase III subunit delta' n=1 Tax=Sciscionella sediminilitoris TaxID=1445613 RepID=UPI0004DF2B14|nr:DNA polymerase III subunit delta' [Sciscionella sp. SE31]
MTNRTGVWVDLVGQTEAVAELSAAASAAANGTGGMTHAWLFTGPPGSGRSVVARSFAAALQCTEGEGCGECSGCHTAIAGTHADVHIVEPEGLSIPVAQMRSLVQLAARRPSAGHWQVVIISDADRLTEGAANALLKAVEEPPDRTVFLLCAPSDHPDDVSVTIRSRCRVINLRTPPAEAIAEVLTNRDGIDPETASWAGSVCGGHIGRARRLAKDPEVRERRESVLRIPGSLRRPADVFACVDQLVGAAESEASSMSAARDDAEKAALRTAMGAGGSGKGTAAAERSAKSAERDLEKRQKSRATRAQRDSLDLALVDLAGFYRDVLATKATGAHVTLNHPDRARDSAALAGQLSAAGALRRIEAILDCREAIELNVKPRIAVEAMLTTLQRG